MSFTPQKAEPRIIEASIYLTATQHAELAEVAARYGMSISLAGQQAIAYALAVDKKPLPADSGLTEPPKRGNLARLASRPQG